MVDGMTILGEQLTALIQETIAMGPRLGAAFVLLLLTWLLSALARWSVTGLAARTRMRRGLRDVLRMLVGAGIWTLGILVAAMVAFPTVTPGRALTALGLGSIAIGFAFKDIFENFFAGTLILLRQPFDIGDHVDADGIEGQVEAISIRDTHIRQTDGQLVVTPNARLFQNPVTVRTNRSYRRTAIICGVAYGEDVDKARQVIADAVRAVDTVRDDVRDVQVFAKAFGPSSIDFEIAWWTGSRPLDIRRSRDQVVGAVKRALDEAGIEIPFPQRTLTLSAGTRTALQDNDAID